MLKTIPAEMMGKTNEELMAMSEEEITDIAIKYGVIDELAALAATKTQKKRYPRVLKPSKNPKLNGKLTWQADTTAKPIIEYTEIGFFEVKAQFIHDICGVPRVEKVKKETFRDRFAAAAAAAKATAAANTEEAKTTKAKKDMDATMDEIFNRK